MDKCTIISCGHFYEYDTHNCIGCGNLLSDNQRMANLITILSRCRQNRHPTYGCGGKQPQCAVCPYTAENDALITMLNTVFHGKSLTDVDDLLPEDVRKEMGLNQVKIIPPLHYKNAWLKLSQILGEQCNQPMLDLMDSILSTENGEL